ncbi:MULTISPECIES: hypothetical protein [unclassified Microbacterium]|uniref:hypothetical protein n=1 Tax=unclassified Microbacterium TaxID=2609290 RepID=UPI000CFD0D5C|nr:MULTISPECIES: hypothetical protein [unclassified Microbacterium]PQZ55705.1 hypothetical protein CQ032_11325 [Microbacterium sp. MYb43]PQZ81037.1 hypothetical protein CQ031_06985 [Microbacterium sp. MYb40]PRB20869.1 hypothetical protein CQ040_11105 [Microbacterium sp. MYb54]PRB31930.1 hypothetical protein CQ037_00770 [Microbacterium sp. MYb50]PRB64455.1 hypothetical protein CQ021_13660 [Microbacterium sp. MYb24]
MRRVWVRELAGWIGSLALALITTAQVASSDRSELLFRDGDSLIVAMFARSVVSGQPLDWAMSSVLFVPESATFALLVLLLPFGVNGLLAINAVLNMIALYGAIRVVAGRRREGTAPVTWSLLGLAAFCVLAMTDLSGSRDALDLASLQSTTTYYSATVVAVVLSVGLVRRVMDRESGGVGLLLALGATAAVSTLSNPLYAVWAVVPITLLLAVMAIRSPQRVRMAMLLAVLLVGTALGFLGRIPLRAWIANTGAGYVQPELWNESLGYYAGLFTDRISTPAGVLGALIVVALIVLAVLRTARAGDAGTRFVAAVAWLTPALVLIGAIALGTHAARYLQPLAFAPVLALVALPRSWRMPFRVESLLAAAAAAVLVVGGVLSVPRLAAASEEADPDLVCVTDWVNASGRTGAGQFWTVRLPKLHLDDPAHLVQVDHELNGYAWLVNRRDFDVGEVSFLVEDAQTVPWALPEPAIPDEVVDCGRYRILDFGDTALPIGPERS